MQQKSLLLLVSLLFAVIVCIVRRSSLSAERDAGVESLFTMGSLTNNNLQVGSTFSRNNPLSTRLPRFTFFTAPSKLPLTATMSLGGTASGENDGGKVSLSRQMLDGVYLHRSHRGSSRLTSTKREDHGVSNFDDQLQVMSQDDALSLLQIWGLRFQAESSRAHWGLAVTDGENPNPWLEEVSAAKKLLEERRDAGETPKTWVLVWAPSHLVDAYPLYLAIVHTDTDEDSTLSVDAIVTSPDKRNLEQYLSPGIDVTVTQTLGYSFEEEMGPGRFMNVISEATKEGVDFAPLVNWMSGRYMLNMPFEDAEGSSSAAEAPTTEYDFLEEVRLVMKGHGDLSKTPAFTPGRIASTRRPGEFITALADSTRKKPFPLSSASSIFIVQNGELKNAYDLQGDSLHAPSDEATDEWKKYVPELGDDVEGPMKMWMRDHNVDRLPFSTPYVLILKELNSYDHQMRPMVQFSILSQDMKYEETASVDDKDSFTPLWDSPSSMSGVLRVPDSSLPHIITLQSSEFVDVSQHPDFAETKDLVRNFVHSLWHTAISP